MIAAIPLDFGLLFEGEHADRVLCIGVEFFPFSAARPVLSDWIALPKKEITGLSQP